MAYITTQELQAFADKYPEDDSLLQGYCDSAEELIENYLGYSPEEKEYTTTAYGLGSRCFALEAKPVTEITSISADGVSLDLAAVKIIQKKPYIAFVDEVIFSSSVKYSVTYKAGFTEVPQMIKSVALQIASLLWESAGGNLAVTSTSFADSGSRTFQSFKPDRFLETISIYRMPKVDY